MIEIIDKKDCCGCSACAQICPITCILMKPDKDGFLYPIVDKQLCIHCHKCQGVCPSINVQSDIGIEPTSYAAYNMIDSVRENSSSGGIFTALAEEILLQGGIVVGATMTTDCKNVQHIIVDSIQELSLLKGSKYIQSNIESTYIQVEKLLLNGKIVLFTGTACEIEGLKHFLGKEYNKLYTQDIICHGVPSPKLWHKYVTYQENRTKANLNRVNFRSKKKGWKLYSIALDFNNNIKYSKIYLRDAFMQFFIQNLSLRPSCYSCKFKKVHRISDITLADFWGSDIICPEYDDDKGLSLVMIHSEKGQELWEIISDKIVFRNVEFKSSIKHNSSMMVASISPNTRADFFEDLDLLDIDALSKKYVTKQEKISIIKTSIKDFIPAPLYRGIIKMLKSKIC